MAPTTRSSKRTLAVLVSDAEDNNPLKRQRIASPKHDVPTPQPATPLTALVKHSSLWLSDGNIVLAAGHACFKVHRSQLARFCTVFEDMLGAPSGGPDEEMMEDCVVVRMPDDSMDLMNFLEAIYNGCFFNFETDKAANFPAVSGVMRLATKYDCPVLRMRIFNTLRTRYPSHRDFETAHGFRFAAPHHTHVINLARECDLLDLLPSCFYQLAFCARISVNGSYVTEPIELLAPADHKRLEKGKDAVLQRVMGLIAEGPPNTAPGCQHVSHTPGGRRGKCTREQNKCAAFLKTYWVEEVHPGKDLRGAVAKEPLEELSLLVYPDENVN